MAAVRPCTRRLSSLASSCAREASSCARSSATSESLIFIPSEAPFFIHYPNIKVGMLAEERTQLLDILRQQRHRFEATEQRLAELSDELRTTAFMLVERLDRCHARIEALERQSSVHAADGARGTRPQPASDARPVERVAAAQRAHARLPNGAQANGAGRRR